MGKLVWVYSWIGCFLRSRAEFVPQGTVWVSDWKVCAFVCVRARDWKGCFNVGKRFLHHSKHICSKVSAPVYLL